MCLNPSPNDLENSQPIIIQIDEDKKTGGIIFAASFSEKIQKSFETCSDRQNSKKSKKKPKAAKKRKPQAKYNFFKNYPKFLGDKICDYLERVRNLDLKKYFKDRVSLKLLNTYLKAGIKEESLSKEFFNTEFLEFILGFDINLVETKIINESSRECYPMITQMFQELSRKVMETLFERKFTAYYLTINSIWPILNISLTLEN